MRRKLFRNLDERRVRLLLGAFFLALAIPAAVLIAQAYGQLKWEAFRQTQLLAEDVAAAIDANLRAAVAAEEARSFGDYSFLVVEGDAAANFVQRSELAAFPVRSALPGALGYFQVDAEGRFTTPLLPADGVAPAAYGIAPEEERARRDLAASIHGILAENRLVPRVEEEQRAAELPAQPSAAESFAAQAPAAVAPAAATQAAFDRLTASAGAPAGQDSAGAANAPAQAPGQGFVRQRASEPALARALPAGNALEARGAAVADAADERQKRTEQVLLAEPEPAAQEAPESPAPQPAVEYRVQTFAGELDPFAVGLLDTGHFVLFRNVWREGRRYVQGALLDRPTFLAGTVEDAFRSSRLAGMSDVRVAYRGTELGTVNAAASPAYTSAPNDLAGTLLYRTRLSPPFGELELRFGVSQLPRPPGAALLAWVSVVLAVVLLGGFALMHRFAIGQIKLTRQQQDFVSAVSHELKTPLTSIRMYGEMLKAGWADEAKKRTYYDYIHSESERLSRLIDNVLQLARLTRNTQRFDMRRVAVAQLMDLVRSRAGTQAERAGFALQIDDAAPPECCVRVDPDCFTQIMINLVDNALKFAAHAERKTVVIGSRLDSGGAVLFTVRDFGPGIPKAQLRKIFELFYRPANELSRETAGTGIGLALVRQLAIAMGGSVDARNREPGAELRVLFPAAE